MRLRPLMSLLVLMTPVAIVHDSHIAAASSCSTSSAKASVNKAIARVLNAPTFTVTFTQDGKVEQVIVHDAPDREKVSTPQLSVAYIRIGSTEYVPQLGDSTNFQTVPVPAGEPLFGSQALGIVRNDPKSKPSIRCSGRDTTVTFVLAKSSLANTSTLDPTIRSARAQVSVRGRTLRAIEFLVKVAGRSRRVVWSYDVSGASGTVRPPA